MHKYALVKWVSGEDKNKYTSNVPVSWIKGFDINEFLRSQADGPSEDADSESYVIEWHQTKTEPKGGWPCFDGIVISTSNSVKYLEKLMANFNGQESGKLKRTSIGMLESCTKQCSTQNTSIKNVTVATQTNEEYITDITDIKSGMLRLEQMLTEVLQSVQAVRESNSTVVSNKETNGNGMVEIYPHSNVMVTEEQWDYIKVKSTCTAMANALIVAIFPLPILLKSNLKGGCSKVKKTEDNNTKFEALDSAKMDAIYNCIRKRHEKTFDKAKIGSSINNKLNKLRAAHKQESSDSDNTKSLESNN